MNLLGDVFAAIIVGTLLLCVFSMAVIVSVTLAAYAYQSVVWALLALSAALQ